MDGYRVTTILEDEYERIVDNTYFAYDPFNSVLFSNDFLIKGFTNISFEELIERNEYFTRLSKVYIGHQNYNLTYK